MDRSHRSASNAPSQALLLATVEGTSGWREMDPVPHATAWTPSWALRNKSRGDMAALKNRVGQWDSF